MGKEEGAHGEKHLRQTGRSSTAAGKNLRRCEVKQHRARYNEQKKKEKAKVTRTKLTRRRERPNTAKARQRCAIADADSELVNMALMATRHDSKTLL